MLKHKNAWSKLESERNLESLMVNFEQKLIDKMIDGGISKIFFSVWDEEYEYIDFSLEQVGLFFEGIHIRDCMIGGYEFNFVCNNLDKIEKSLDRKIDDFIKSRKICEKQLKNFLGDN